MITHAEAFEHAMVEGLARNTKLTQDTFETDGTQLNLLCHMIAAAADVVGYTVRAELDGLFIDTAEGDALSRLVNDRYGVLKHGETAAEVPLTFARTGSAPLVNVPAGTVVSTGSGVRFSLDAGFTWPLSDVDPVNVNATCLVTGPTGNVAAGTITRVETSLGDANITVTNTQAATGGAVSEDDADLKVRARGARDPDRLGIGARIEKSALEVPTIRKASAYVAVDVDGRPAGGGTLVIADGTGAANDVLVAEVLEKVSADALPFGAWLDVLGASVRLENIAVNATWDPGAATPANAEALRQAIIAAVNNLQPRAAPDDEDPEAQCLLTHAVIQEVRVSVPGLRRIVVTTPVGTVEPDQGEVIRAGSVVVS